jgi:hypothetical protein
MYFDGSLNIDGAGAGMLFISPNKDELRYILRLHFPACQQSTTLGIPLDRLLTISRRHKVYIPGLLLHSLHKESNFGMDEKDFY